MNLFSSTIFLKIFSLSYFFERVGSSRNLRASMIEDMILFFCTEYLKSSSLIFALSWGVSPKRDSLLAFMQR